MPAANASGADTGSGVYCQSTPAIAGKVTRQFLAAVQFCGERACDQRTIDFGITHLAAF